MGLLDIFGGGSDTPSINTGRLNDIVKAGSDSQKSTVGNISDLLKKNLGIYRTDMQGALDKAATARQTNNSAFLNSLKEKTTAANNTAFNTGSQQILGGVRGAQDAIRENLSGSGVGLQGGAAVKALNEPVLKANQDIDSLAKMLTSNAQQSEINAEGTIQNQNNQAIAQSLGIDQDTYNTILNSGDQNLINEMNSLLGIDSQSTADQLGIEQLKQTNDIAAAQAAAQSRAALISSLLGGAATLGSAGIMSGGNSRLIQALNDAKRSGGKE